MEFDRYDSSSSPSPLWICLERDENSSQEEKLPSLSSLHSYMRSIPPVTRNEDTVVTLTEIPSQSTKSRISTQVPKATTPSSAGPKSRIKISPRRGKKLGVNDNVFSSVSKETTTHVHQNAVIDDTELLVSSAGEANSEINESNIFSSSKHSADMVSTIVNTQPISTVRCNKSTSVKTGLVPSSTLKSQYTSKIAKSKPPLIRLRTRDESTPCKTKNGDQKLDSFSFIDFSREESSGSENFVIDEASVESQFPYPGSECDGSHQVAVGSSGKTEIIFSNTISMADSLKSIVQVVKMGKQPQFANKMSISQGELPLPPISRLSDSQENDLNSSQEGSALPPLSSIAQFSSAPKETISVKSHSQLISTPPPQEEPLNSEGIPEQTFIQYQQAPSVTNSNSDLSLLVTPSNALGVHNGFKPNDLSPQYMSQNVNLQFEPLQNISDATTSKLLKPNESLSHENGIVGGLVVSSDNSSVSKLHITTSVENIQNVMTRSIPETYTSQLFSQLSRSGTLPAMLCNQVNSVLSALDENQLNHDQLVLEIPTEHELCSSDEIQIIQHSQQPTHQDQCLQQQQIGVFLPHNNQQQQDLQVLNNNQSQILQDDQQWHKFEQQIDELKPEIPKTKKKDKKLSEKGKKKKQKLKKYGELPNRLTDAYNEDSTDTQPSDLNNTMHSYCKRKKDGLENNTEEFESSKKHKKSKAAKLEKISSNLVERVACFKCKFCLFLSMKEDVVKHHVQQEHWSRLPNDDMGIQCPGCSNVFFSLKPLEVHLCEDHRVAEQELGDILNGIVDSEHLEKFKVRKTKRKGKNDSSRKKSKIAEHNAGDKASSNHDLEAEKRNSNQEKDVSGTKLHSQLGTKHLSSNKLSETEPAPADETGKIRVRKLALLESSSNHRSSQRQNEEKISNRLHEEEEVNECYTELRGNLSVVFEEGAAIIDRENERFGSPMPSLQMLQEQQNQNSIQQSDIEQLHHQNTTLQNIDMDCASKFGNCQVSCDDLIEERCDNDSDQVFYVDSVDMSDTEEISSQLVVNFDSPECDEVVSLVQQVDEELYDTISLGNNYNRKLGETDANGILETDSASKRPQKRGKRTKGDFGEKITRKRKKDASPENSDVKPESVGYRCNINGCSIRLFSHDKLEYHQRCHRGVLTENTEKNDVATDTEVDKCTAKVKESIAGSKFDFRCPECLEEIRTWATMSQHLWRHHSIDIELYTCEQCGYKTSSLSNMKNIHQRIHGTERSFLCDVCGKGFKTPKQLRNHKDLHVKKAKAAAGDVIKCDICGRSFHENRMLRSHINSVHHKMRPFSCSICGHRASNRSSLKMHIRQHTGDRPYKCEMCEYSTADHNSLRRHKKRHTGDKPYKCPYCTYACIQSSTYKVHLRNKHPGHDSGLMFSCNKCTYHTISHDMFLAHNADHDGDDNVEPRTEPQLKAKPRLIKRRKAHRVDIPQAQKAKPEAEEAAVATAAVSEPMPIILSISTGDAVHATEAPIMHAVVEGVSEAIIPGNNLHLLYNNFAITGLGVAIEQPNSNIVHTPVPLGQQTSEIMLPLSVLNDALIGLQVVGDKPPPLTHAPVRLRSDLSNKTAQ